MTKYLLSYSSNNELFTQQVLLDSAPRSCVFETVTNVHFFSKYPFTMVKKGLFDISVLFNENFSFPIVILIVGSRAFFV